MNNNCIKIVGGNIKTIREEAGLSQQELAKILHVSFQQVHKYETGLNRLPIDKLYLLKSFFNLPYDLFFDGMGAENSTKNLSVRSSHYFRGLSLFGRVIDEQEPQLRNAFFAS